MNPSQTKASRLLQIEALLLAHPEGMKPAEIARRLGVHRSTICRYLPDLPLHIYFDEADGHRWKIDRSADLVNVRFNLHEATALHLATRLLVRNSDRQNNHAAAALRKLALALERLAPHISRHMHQSAEAMESGSQRADPVYLQALEGLTCAWAQGRKVRLWYCKGAGEPVSEYIFCPYYLEPSAVGRSTYAFGWCDTAGGMRTFKLERIQRVALLDEEYQVPAEFSPAELLADAWGIWFSEGEPVEVVLRFSARVASRVRETRWHRAEQTTGLPDGRLEWRAEVAEPTEMLPWIRGWGADCEVLEPIELREKVADEARRMAGLYIHTGD